jgi:hypothetical protein
MNAIAKGPHLVGSEYREVPLLGGLLVYSRYPTLPPPDAPAKKPSLALVSDREVVATAVEEAPVPRPSPPGGKRQPAENPAGPAGPTSEAPSLPGLARPKAPLVRPVSVADATVTPSGPPFEEAPARAIAAAVTAPRPRATGGARGEERNQLRTVAPAPIAPKTGFVAKVLRSLFTRTAGPATARAAGAADRWASLEGERSFFFRALDDRRLYKLGDSFYRDFKAGKRSFGFGNVTAADAQKRSILGVASFIKYFDDLKVLVVTEQMAGTFFAPFKTQGQRLTATPTDPRDVGYEVIEAYGVHYLELGQFLAAAPGRPRRKIASIVKRLRADYDLLLVDLPPERARLDRYDVYLPFLQTLDHVTLSVCLRGSRFSELREMKDYFSSYKIPIKGTVVDRGAGGGG